MTQVRVNDENPRMITKVKFQKLIDSLLAFPAMLEIRPVVVDNRMVALGGNMRVNALRAIAKMDVEELAERLYRLPEYQEMDASGREKLVEHWGRWLDSPNVTIVKASRLTEQERRQFLIKDNVSLGQWDYDALANKWDNNRLEAWGMDVWKEAPTEFSPIPGFHTQPAQECNPVDMGNSGNNIDNSTLPPELQGRDLTPDPLDNIKGDDETTTEHIIITYLPDELPLLATYLGIDQVLLGRKIVWRLDDLIEARENIQNPASVEGDLSDGDN